MRCGWIGAERVGKMVFVRGLMMLFVVALGSGCGHKCVEWGTEYYFDGYKTAERLKCERFVCRRGYSRASNDACVRDDKIDAYNQQVSADRREVERKRDEKDKRKEQRKANRPRQREKAAAQEACIAAHPAHGSEPQRLTMLWCECQTDQRYARKYSEWCERELPAQMRDAGYPWSTTQTASTPSPPPPAPPGRTRTPTPPPPPRRATTPSPPPPPATTPTVSATLPDGYESLTGTWDSPYGKVNLVVTGKRVRATYPNGKFEGEFDEQRVLHMEWASTKTPTFKGGGEFFIVGPNELKGSYWYSSRSDHGGNWHMTR